MARIVGVKETIATLIEHPLLGEGVPGGRAIYDVQYSRIFREVGLVGFCIFIWLIARILKTAWRYYSDQDLDNFHRGLSMGLICAVLGLLMMGIAAETFIIIRIMEPFWFVAGIVVALPLCAPKPDCGLV